jgi:hypothetical protein
MREINDRVKSVVDNFYAKRAAHYELPGITDQEEETLLKHWAYISYECKEVAEQMKKVKTLGSDHLLSNDFWFNLKKITEAFEKLTPIHKKLLAEHSKERV